MRTRLGIALAALAAAAAGCAGGPDPQMAASYVEAGQEAARKGDHAGAIELYGRAIRENPDFAEAYNRRGYSYVQLRLDRRSPKEGREYEDLALKDFEQAVRKNPAYGDAYFNRAMVYSSRAQYKAAVEDLLHAAQYRPRDPEPHLWLGRLYDEKFEDKLVAANEHFEKYVDLGGLEPEVRERVKLWKELKKQAAAPAPKAPTADDEKKAQELHETFKRLFAEGRKDEAVKAIETLVSQYGHTKYAQEQQRIFEALLRSLKK